MKSSDYYYPKARVRTFIGGLFLIVYLIAYCLIVGALMHNFLDFSSWIKVLSYAIAGLVWVLPLKPLFSWMSKS